MFGFQRIMTYLRAGDQARGFLLGATSGRTTLMVKVQNQDGHSHILAATIPNCKRMILASYEA